VAQICLVCLFVNDLLNVGDSSASGMARLQAEQPGDLGPICGSGCGSQDCFISSPYICTAGTGTSSKVARM
jgi:hypothetical protein